MNKLLNLALVMMSVFYSVSASSAFVLNGTRYIYNGSKNGLSVEVTNYAERMYGGQIWIENTADTPDIPFSVMPNMFTLKPESKQKIQIANLINDSLADDRESMFWLNLQEIPSKDKNDAETGNALILAARTTVKLLYRPKSIEDGRNQAEEKMRITKQGDTLTLKNGTAYYFAVLSVNGHSVNEHDPLTAFKPFSQYTLSVPGVSNSVTFSAIDDWGAVRRYQCDLRETQKQCQYQETVE